MQNVWKKPDSPNNNCVDHRQSNRNDQSKTCSQHQIGASTARTFGKAGFFPISIISGRTRLTSQAVECRMTRPAGTTVKAYQWRGILTVVSRFLCPAITIWTSIPILTASLSIGNRNKSA